jgi:hypothetical protein
MKILLLITGFLFLFATEILRVYFIMPFPGSQHNNTIDIAYWLDQHIIWVRILALLLLAYPAISVLRHSKIWKRIILILFLGFYVVVFYFFNFRFEADKMFYQLQHQNFSSAGSNKIPADKLIIGVEINGEAKAYPIQIIGYHHQVRDTIGNTPIMIAYCTVCRAGRAFSPIVNGKNETFRLVGMDHFNAMFEDASTKSWWRQETGTAIAGSLKGTSLREIPSQQSTLAAWMLKYPNSSVLQPDTVYAQDYKDLADFDKGTIKSSLEKRDSASWQFKSWVVGIAHDKSAKAYDWNELVSKKMIQDSLPGLPLVLVLEKDTASFHAWSRNVAGISLRFVNDDQTDILKDLNTQSRWNMNGLCLEGSLKGQQLQLIQSYQEFWHSWQTFHPNTTRYR